MVFLSRRKWAGRVARIEDNRNAFNSWVEGNGPVGGIRREWESNVRVNVEEICRKYVDWIHLAQDVKE
jgi:transcription antitermination factor NusA-like protein